MQRLKFKEVEVGFWRSTGALALGGPKEIREWDKGLAPERLGLGSLIVIGLGSTAPLYSLACTLGLVVIGAGVQAPVALIVAFIPMMLTALAYRELNNVMPDAGTAFTWGAKAVGPRTGWFAGWGVFVASVIVMAAQSEIASKYLLYLLAGEEMGQNKVVVTAFAAFLILVMTWLSYRNIEAGAKTQAVLIVLQYLAIVAFGVGLWRAIASGNFALDFDWAWFNPFAAESPAGFMQAVLIGIFIYWGWDSCLCLAEESKNPRTAPGMAAVLSTCMLLITYVGITVLTMMYVGTEAEGNGLANPEVSDDVFYLLRQDTLGDWGWLLLFAIFVSAFSTCQTTILPAARGTLAMGVYKALPPRFSQITPKYLTPAFSTWFMGLTSLAFYVGMTLINGDILADTIESTSLAVASYYIITAVSCVVYFRKTALDSVRNVVFRLLIPVLGAVTMSAVFIYSVISMSAADYGKTVLLGTSGTFVMGVGSLAFGIVIMAVLERLPVTRPYFQCQTIVPGTDCAEGDNNPLSPAAVAATCV